MLGFSAKINGQLLVIFFVDELELCLYSWKHCFYLLADTLSSSPEWFCILINVLNLDIDLKKMMFP